MNPLAHSSPLRVGLVGANWGATHVEAWQHVPGAEVVAICTAHRETAEAVASKYGIPQPFWDADAMLETGRLNIVDVMLRPKSRVPIVFKALQHRKHVLQPLPFALNLAQGQELLQQAQAAGVIANIESLHRYAPAFLQAKAMIDDGFLGDVYTWLKRAYAGEFSSTRSPVTSTSRNFCRSTQPAPCAISVRKCCTRCSGFSATSPRFRLRSRRCSGTSSTATAPPNRTARPIPLSPSCALPAERSVRCTRRGRRPAPRVSPSMRPAAREESFCEPTASGSARCGPPRWGPHRCNAVRSAARGRVRQPGCDPRRGSAARPGLPVGIDVLSPRPGRSQR